MTKLQMLAEIYAHLSQYYGIELTPTNQVLRIPKERVSFLYRVFAVNKTFIGDDIRAIEDNINFQASF